MDKQQEPLRSPYASTVQEFIDFVNMQSGMYMDALAGFAGNYVRIERQVHRISRAQRIKLDKTGEPVVVWTSYEDPNKPDVICNRIMPAHDYLAQNAVGGSNEEQHARSVVIFLFTYWEDEIRPRLAAANGVELNAIRSDIMGDVRNLRQAILHTKGILRTEHHRKLKVVQDMFELDQPVSLPQHKMQQLFVLIKKDGARLLYSHLRITDPAVEPEELRDITIQRRGGP